MKNRILKSLFLILSVIVLAGCKSTDNFLAYFNTYYNANRLLDESETEFEYQDEKKRVMPRVFITQPNYWVNPDQRKSPIVFMEEFIIDNRKLQPVKIKLDSIIIKGSKILAKYPESDFIERTLYLMATSYFYQSDWVNCQVKCSELIDKFPRGELVPDAHLMIAKTYLVRKQIITGLTILSRTVDVAWLQKRYDILSEAFRLEAEVAIRDSRFEDALKPYFQAIAQCDDDKQKAKWQVDLAALLYRIGKYDKAAIAFQQVENYDPDYAGMFESRYYHAMCQIRLGKQEEGLAKLEELENDKKFEEWREYIIAGRLVTYTLANDSLNYKKYERFADSAYSNSQIIQAAYFEKAMLLFDKKDYALSKRYLAQVRNARSPYFSTANKVYQTLTQYTQTQNYLTTGVSKLNSKTEESTDSLRVETAKFAYEFARINENLGNRDSALYYYKMAMDVAPVDSSIRAQFLYTYQRMIRKDNPIYADSLYEQLADLYPKTEYGREAYKVLGYTEFYAIDTLPELYKSASQMRKNGLYPQAIKTFSRIYQNYEGSDYAPKSLYSIGLIYETKYKQMDSAAYYYNLLVEKYPTHELVNEINTSVAFKKVVDSNSPMPDSLKKKVVFQSPKRNYLAEIEEGNEIKRSTSFDKQMKLEAEPSTLDKLWNSVKESVKESVGKTFDQVDSLKSKGKDILTLPDIKLNSPLDMFDKDKNTNPEANKEPMKPNDPRAKEMLRQEMELKQKQGQQNQQEKRGN